MNLTCTSIELRSFFRPLLSPESDLKLLCGHFSPQKWQQECEKCCQQEEQHNRACEDARPVSSTQDQGAPQVGFHHGTKNQAKYQWSQWNVRLTKKEADNSGCVH